MIIKRAAVVLIIVLLASVAFRRPIKDDNSSTSQAGPVRSTSQAGPMPQPKPLMQIVSQANIIVVARLIKYVPDNTTPTTSLPSSKPAIGAISSIVNLPGLYTFSVIQSLKGKCEPKLQLRLPYLLSVSYGNADLTIEEGNQMLVFLQSDIQGRQVPADDAVPIVKLANSPQIVGKSGELADLKSHVTSLLLDSLSDATIRRANTYLIRSIVDPQIPRALAPYSTDPDLHVQDNVLYSMMINQQVSSIPRVANLEAKLSLQNRGTEAVIALQKLQTPKAVPYLNALLFQVPQWTRVNAMFALNKLADRSSIPYLVLALRDPESQNIVSYSAYTTLHRLVPDLGPTKDWDLFQVQGEVANRSIYNWWKDELAGKHVQEETGKQPAKSKIEVSALSVQQINPLLFEPSLRMRQEAVAALEKRADHSSIPYLILALIDPDATVSDSAYKTLYRLIPALGKPKSEKDFEGHQEVATQPIYDWWEDELLGKHVSLQKRRP